MFEKKRNIEVLTNTMLSIQECREILKDHESTDKEIEDIRNELQPWVELAYDSWTEDRKKKEKSLKKGEIK